MENVTDALKMAFAVLVFLLALSLAFSTITQAKETADVILFANDKANYYEKAEIEKYFDKDGNPINVRMVAEDTVISTLYRCKNETMVVEVIDKYGNSTIFDSSEDKEELNRKNK